MIKNDPTVVPAFEPGPGSFRKPAAAPDPRTAASAPIAESGKRKT
jgi:hypothetical protein